MKVNKINANKITKALIQAGAPIKSLPYILAQVSHETAGFNSKILITDNNASGIIYINKPTKQKNASKGSPFPKKEGQYNYARFATLKDWAKDYLRIIGTAAASAKSLPQFAQSLKNKGFYTDSVQNYSNGLKYNAAALTKAGIFKTAKNNGLYIAAALIGAYVLYRLSK